MSRWIDVDAVESTLQEMEMITAMSHIELGEEDDDIGEIKMPMFTVRNIMKTAPSIDFVTCAECIHFTKLGDGWGRCNVHSRIAQTIDFCSWGERKENE